MLLTQNRLIHTPILSLQTGAPLGQTARPIIDPRQLVVSAFYCEGPRVQNTAVLHPSDIREVSNLGFIVDGAHALMPPDDLVRLQEIIRFNFELIGKKVFDTHKRKLGRVQNYSVETTNFYIMKLHVQQPVLRNFFSGGLLMIDRSQVVEVNDNRIVVRGGDAKQTATDAPKLFQNPFRHQPQAGNSNSEVPHN
jgi:sporulation protein YlmC with PRC-barrel domain